MLVLLRGSACDRQKAAIQKNIERMVERAREIVKELILLGKNETLGFTTKMHAVLHDFGQLNSSAQWNMNEFDKSAGKFIDAVQHISPASVKML